MSTTRVKMSNQNSTRNFLRKMRVFKAKHPWITVKPPRNPCDKPKTKRNIPQAMSTTRTRVKMSNQKSTRNFLRKMRAFKAKHPWITVKPPRNPCYKPKTQRNIPQSMSTTRTRVKMSNQNSTRNFLRKNESLQG